MQSNFEQKDQDDDPIELLMNGNNSTLKYSPLTWLPLAEWGGILRAQSLFRTVEKKGKSFCLQWLLLQGQVGAVLVLSTSCPNWGSCPLTSCGALIQGLKATAMTLWRRIECQVFSYPIANKTLQTMTPKKDEIPPKEIQITTNKYCWIRQRCIQALGS